MVRLSLYFMIIVVIVAAILRARAGYLQWKLWKYIRKNYPEKEREFGCVKGGWLNEFALVQALYKENGIEDAEFIRLKTQTRRVWTGILVLIGASVCIILVGLVVLVVTRI